MIVAGKGPDIFATQDLGNPFTHPFAAVIRSCESNSAGCHPLLYPAMHNTAGIQVLFQLTMSRFNCVARLQLCTICAENARQSATSCLLKEAVSSSSFYTSREMPFPNLLPIGA
jgi:hypothetical protein